MAAMQEDETSAGRHLHMGGQFRPSDHRTEGLVHKSRQETLGKNYNVCSLKLEPRKKMSTP